MESKNSTENFSSVWNTSGSENNASSTSSTQHPIGYYGEIRVLLWQIVPPILIVFGTTGNLLTVLVITRMKKLSTTAMYLLTLAVSDTTILFCGPLRNWIRNMWDKDIRSLSNGACKIQLYLTYASIHFSAWLLVAVTMERTISVILPHKVKLACTRRNAGIVILLLFVFTFGVDIVIPVTQGLDAYDNKICAPTTKEYLDFRNYVWQWIDLCMAFAVPFIFLVTGNIVIIVCLYRSRMKQRKMAIPLSNRNKNSNRKDVSVYILMAALCCIFLLTMTPVTVYQIYTPFLRQQLRELYKTDPTTAWNDYQLLLLKYTIFNLVGYTNAAFNFVLYVFTGTKFRTELKKLFTDCKSSNRASYVSGNERSKEIKTKSTTLPATSDSARVIG